MIPLGHWLGRTPETQKQEDLAPPVEAPRDECLYISPHQDQVDATERLRELEDALAAARVLAEAERVRAVAREEELSLQLGTSMADRISASLTLGLAELQRAVEAAVVEALIPFLTLASRRRAATDLITLIREETANGSDVVLEVRAPEHLHGVLEIALGSSETAISLSESPLIEVIYSGHRSRFEALTERWIDTVRGLQDG